LDRSAICPCSPKPNNTVMTIYADFEFGRLFGDVYFRRYGTTYTNNCFLTTGNKKYLNRVRFELTPPKRPDSVPIK
jgi:hypothetical protein